MNASEARAIYETFAVYDKQEVNKELKEIFRLIKQECIKGSSGLYYCNLEMSYPVSVQIHKKLLSLGYVVRKDRLGVSMGIGW